MSDVSIFVKMIEFNFDLFCMICSFLRDMFQAIQKEVDKKQFDEFQTIFVLDYVFFRYICPSIVDPVKWQIVEQIPTHALQGCIAACKILNDLALRNTDKWEKVINEWIIKKHPPLLEFTQKLIVSKSDDALLKRNNKFTSFFWIGSKRNRTGVDDY